jgi:hypothetical protein
MGWVERVRVDLSRFPWFDDVVKDIKGRIEKYPVRLSKGNRDGRYISAACYAMTIVMKRMGIICTPVFFRVLDKATIQCRDHASYIANARLLLSKIASSPEYDPETQKLQVEISGINSLYTWYISRYRVGASPNRPRPWTYLGKITGYEAIVSQPKPQPSSQASSGDTRTTADPEEVKKFALVLVDLAQQKLVEAQGFSEVAADYHYLKTDYIPNLVEERDRIKADRDALLDDIETLKAENKKLKENAGSEQEERASWSRVKGIPERTLEILKNIPAETLEIVVAAAGGGKR